MKVVIKDFRVLYYAIPATFRALRFGCGLGIVFIMIAENAQLGWGVHRASSLRWELRLRKPFVSRGFPPPPPDATDLMSTARGKMQAKMRPRIPIFTHPTHTTLTGGCLKLTTPHSIDPRITSSLVAPKNGLGCFLSLLSGFLSGFL